MTSGKRTECQILDDLGVPANRRNSVVILSTSAHMDWDWLERYPVLIRDGNAPYFSDAGYDRKPADIILDGANHYLTSQKQPIPPISTTATVSYYYDVCEMGFLRAYCEDPVHGTNRIKQLRSVGPRLRIVGGGTTSPDNLLPNGEAFIRDYLVGQVWVSNTLGQTTSVGWIPDDFGHDPQLPVVFESMGIPYTGFARVPGDTYTGWQPVNGSQSVADALRNSSCDFIWKASDGSTVQAHWMPDAYSQGGSISSGNNINTYVSTNSPCSKTDYIHVPVCNDFMNANGQLLSYVQSYNSQNAGTYAALASFADYAALVAFQKQKIPTHTSFLALPYWMGFYASRPANKSYHQRATRALIGAETCSLITTLLGVATHSATDLAEQFAAAWELLTPSTHHDYITGTAGTQYADVYGQEQLPLLARALRNAEAIYEQALTDITANIATKLPANYAYQTPFIAFNQLGFERTDLVEIEDGASLGAQTLTVGGNQVDLVQATADGNLLVQVTAPSLGYSLNSVDTQQGKTPNSNTSVAISQDLQNNTVTLSNKRLKATIAASANWGISSLFDIAKGHDLFSGNAGLEVFDDSGGVYTFGNEHDDGTFSPALPGDAKWSAGTAQIVESGPLRVAVEALVRLNFSATDTVDYRLRYSLSEGEDYLRVGITGRAPTYTSVMFKMPMADVGSITRGTGYHWDDQTLVPYSPNYLFYPCHDYVLANDGAGKSASAVVYQSGIPCWGYAINSSGTAQQDTPLYGVLFRNAPSSAWGAGGPDNGTHTQEFALAPSTTIDSPKSGEMLQQSRRFSTPLIGRLASPFTSQKLSRTNYSLAGIDGNNQAALLTAAKAGSFDSSDTYIRIYDPTTTSPKLSLSIAPELQNKQIEGSTALEGPLPAQKSGALNIKTNGSKVSFTAKRAITTLEFK